MAPSRLRKAIGAVKDQTSISLAKAKAGGSDSISDLKVAIVKATRHDEYPAEERHVREILSLTCYSRAHVAACVATIAKRLGRTKNWVVALKALILIHRLLNDGDLAYEQEIFFATRRGTRLLNMSDFRDTSRSRSESWDYSAFVRTYAMYLDEQLEFRMQKRGGKKRRAFVVAVEEEGEEEETAVNRARTPVKELKNEHVYTRINHYVNLLERFLACKPTGAARSNRVVLVALFPVVKESFVIYHEMAELLGILIDRFMELNIPDSVKVHEIFCRVAKQFDELDMFYNWCKATGIARSSEYPDVDNYPQNKLDLMDNLIREKSQLERNKRVKIEEPEIIKIEPEPKEQDQETEPDMNAIKALPPPEDFFEEVKEEKKTQEIGDLLNLGEDAPTVEDHGDQLALALFGGDVGSAAAGAGGVAPWEAFKDSGDWETALVQSASHLSNQKPQLPLGFDSLLLQDGMYQMNHAMTTPAMGSASSVLALPAPPGAANVGPAFDPFAASLSIPPPAYVQMSEMEKKQKLLMEEQMMWQQYARDGMQVNYYPYTRTY